MTRGKIKRVAITCLLLVVGAGLMYAQQPTAALGQTTSGAQPYPRFINQRSEVLFLFLSFFLIAEFDQTVTLRPAGIEDHACLTVDHREEEIEELL